MCPIKFEQLAFDHIVEFTKDSTLFAAARENGNDHLRIFLINEASGRVYTRNGSADSWEELTGNERITIISRLLSARNNHIPVYKVNGYSGSQ